MMTVQQEKRMTTMGNKKTKMEQNRNPSKGQEKVRRK